MEHEPRGALVGIESYPLMRDALDAQRGRRRDYLSFIYEAFTAVTGLTQGTPIELLVDVDTDAPFLWVGCMGIARNVSLQLNSSLVENFDATVDVRIGGRGGRSISRTPLPFISLFSYRPFPVYLPGPQLIAAGSQFFIELTPRLATTPDDHEIALQFLGCKIYESNA